MTISIVQYRAAVGSFTPTNYLDKLVKTKKRNKLCFNSYSNILSVLSLVILAMTIFASCMEISERQNISSKWTESCKSKFRYSATNLDNKYAKYTYGNKKPSGIRIFHLNKGNSHLKNKISEIENIIANHHPHVLGLSEGNFYQHQNLDSVQIKNYKLINAKSVNNPVLKVSRICVYLHNSLVGKVCQDLMDDEISSIWIEVGLPHKRKIIIGNVYREWGLMGQDDPAVSRDLSAQRERWSAFLSQWERALDEDKEVIVLGDMNINHLEWTRTDLPHTNQTYKVKSLISDLFSRILPYGVSQLVTAATWSRANQPESGLDHLYSNNPSKLSPVQVLQCGGSDHKLIGCTRYYNLSGEVVGM